MFSKVKLVLSTVFCLAVVLASAAFAASPDSVISRWEKEQTFGEQDGSSVLEIKVTYYSAEYVEAVVQKEAEKNLWTDDEMQNYKYNMLKALKLDEYIPIHIALNNMGSSMHMAPFDSQLTLWAGKKKYEPADYDKRFNFKLIGKRDGLVFFPRFDEKTGKSILDGVRSVRLVFYDGISPATMGKTVDFIWDVSNDDPQKLYGGKAASKLELDRLIKRMEILSGKKKDLEAQLAEIQAELDSINARVEELQKQ